MEAIQDVRPPFYIQYTGQINQNTQNLTSSPSQSLIWQWMLWNVNQLNLSTQLMNHLPLPWVDQSPICSLSFI